MVRRSNGKLVEIENLKSLTVVGDLHGDFASFQKIMGNWKDEKDSYIVFLGDYADRGSNGLEIIERLEKLKGNENVVLLKGNHEDYSEDGNPSFRPCTLINEVQSKRGYRYRDSSFFDTFPSWKPYFSKHLNPFFKSLYLASVAEKSILLLHGGISSKITSLDYLARPTREIEEDVLWSDPDRFGSGEHPNERGVGVEFGKDVTKRILRGLDVSLIIRSHQPNLARKGPNFTHDGRVITISSTDIYGGRPHYIEIPGSKIAEIAASPREIKKYARIL